MPAGPPPPLPTQQPAPPPFDPSTLSLRQLVEHFAAEAGVEFLPKLGRMHEGLQVAGGVGGWLRLWAGFGRSRQWVLGWSSCQS